MVVNLIIAVSPLHSIQTNIIEMLPVAISPGITDTVRNSMLSFNLRQNVDVVKSMIYPSDFNNWDKCSTAMRKLGIPKPITIESGRLWDS